MRMWTELKVIQQLKTTQAYNMILFYLQRIPGLGRKIPNRFYHAEKFKHVVTVIGTIGYFLSKILATLLYFVFILLLSVFFLATGSLDSAPLSSVFSTNLFFFSVIAGTFTGITRIEPGSTFDILCIKQLKMEAKRYYLAQMLFNYGYFFITYSLSLGFAFYLLDLPVIQALFFTGWLLGLRLLNQILYISIYSLKRPSPEKPFNILMIIMVVVGSISPSLYGFGLIDPSVSWVYTVWALFAGMILVGISVPILKQSNKYEEIVRTTLTSENIQKIQTLQKDAPAVGVKLDEDALTNDDLVQVDSKATGISYINVLFFARLGHLLKKRTKRSAAVLAGLVLVIVGIIIGVEYFQVAEVTQTQIESFFAGPWHVIVIYMSLLAYIGEYFTKFCFYNMDRMLMKNNYYRKPEYLLESIWIRFKISLRYNLPLFLLVVIGTAVIYFVGGGRSASILLLALLSAAITMMFFSMHFLFLYYLIQPYTENMENKSLIYTIATFATFYVPSLLLQFSDNLSQSIVFVIYGFMLVYLAVGLFAVVKLAPKRFKLR